MSAFVTGGIGPWVPYQMLGVGWVGMGAGFLPQSSDRRRQFVWLGGYGAASGLIFGALLNLWFWPFAAPGGEVSAGLAWSPDLTFTESLRRYVTFYMVTSFWFDLFRAVGNVVLIVALARPVLGTLERYRDRFHWEVWSPAAAVDHPPQTESA